MKKEKKIEIVETIRKNLENAQAVFLVDYSGVDVKTLESVREQVKELGDSFNVIKNTLVARYKMVQYIEFAWRSQCICC